MKRLCLSLILCCSVLYGCSENDSDSQEDFKFDEIENIEDMEDKKETESLTKNFEKDSMKRFGKYKNEYGESWEIKNDGNYNNFTLTSRDGSYYFTGSGRSVGEVSIGDSMKDVINVMGEPLEHMIKGNILYDVNSDEYLVYNIGNEFYTLFFDKHNESKLRSVLIIPEKTEYKKDGFYGEVNSSLQDGLEDLMVDLINESRVSNGLSVLNYDKDLNNVSRAHSADMIENNYFDHIGIDGSSAKDRMERYGYREKMYGENIAYGQYSSIFAHEELMNSLGHRENILNEDFTHVGVGVEFTEERVPFYTVNFYTK